MRPDLKLVECPRRRRPIVSRAARAKAMPTADELKAKLTASTIAPTHVEITDTSNCGCGSKFEAIIVAESFDGMGPLDRQRAVNEVIAEEMETIHAFSQKCWTPAQYEKKKATLQQQ